MNIVPYLPASCEDFRVLIDEKLLFVDKTLLIKEFIDRSRGARVNLITRPRRFGKTLNLSMLHYFFAEKVDNKPTKGLFDGLKISETGEQYMAYQGQYPVIFLTFKEIEAENYEALVDKTRELISNVYSKHLELLDSPYLMVEQKNDFKKIVSCEADESHLKTALFNLTKYLYTHYQKKVILLIDEYDAPIQANYFNNYYEKAIKMMRGLLGSCLKTNRYLERALLTGIARVFKENLFSGLNNLKVHSLLDKKYQEHFGFTEKEVNMLADKMGYEDKLVEMKAWYNGYEIGDTTLYNPWSIISCLDNEGLIENYWLNTRANELIKKLLFNSSMDFKKNFERLLRGKTINEYIREDMVFNDLEQDESLIWSLFFVAGYLKIAKRLPSKKKQSSSIYCALQIPNKEINNFYSCLIQDWLRGKKDEKWYATFVEHLLAGRVKEFEAGLKIILGNIASNHDVANETFYHGLVIGFLATLNDYEIKNYEIKSNRESGKGRYDIAVIPHDSKVLGLLFELKSVAKNTKDATFARRAQKALQQIDDKNYVAEFKQRGVHKILKIALVFKGKDFKLEYAEENLIKIQELS